MSGLFKKARKFRDERPAPAPLAPEPAQIAPYAPPPAGEVSAPLQPAPIAPAPAPRAKAWPYGAVEFVPGAWYVGAAGPFKTPDEYWAWKAAVDRRDSNLEDRTQWTAPGRGRIPAAGLSRDDAAYLWHRHHDYRLKRRNGDLFREVLSGSHEDINRAIQLADTTNPGMNPWAPDNVVLIDAANIAFASIPDGERN